MITAKALHNRIKAVNNQLMYGHTMTIWRQTSVKQPDKSTKVMWAVMQEGVPCKLSKKDLDKGGDIKEDANPIIEAFVVFCDPEITVRAGDLLEIDGVKYRAGNPYPYPTHQEITAARSDLA